MLVTNVDNLRPFVHPTTRRRYDHMDPGDVREIVERLAGCCGDSSPLPILSVDSGSYPLGRLISARVGSEHRRLKVPRAVTPDLAVYVLFMLGDTERSQTVDWVGCSQIEALRDADDEISRLVSEPFTGGTREQAIWHFAPALRADPPVDLSAGLESYDRSRRSAVAALFNLILCGTDWATWLARPFLLVEEYVTSGTVLSVVNTTLALFNRAFQYELLCYSLATSPAEAPPFLRHTVLNGPTWNQHKAYPYENRLDLLGFFYTETPTRLIRTEIASWRPRGRDADPAPLLQQLADVITAKDVIGRINEGLPIEDLRSFNGPPHAMRWALRLLESDPVVRDFWDQLFEMYAPSWSPLPVSFHLGFTGAFAQADWFAEAVAPAQGAYDECSDRLVRETVDALAYRYDSYWQHALPVIGGPRND